MVENLLAPITDPIISLLTHSEPRNLLLNDVTRSCRTRLDFLTNILLKVPNICGRYFVSPKEIRGKSFPK